MLSVQTGALIFMPVKFRKRNIRGIRTSLFDSASPNTEYHCCSVFFNVSGHLPDDNGFLNTNTTPQRLFLKADFLPFLFLGPALVMPRGLVYRLVVMVAILNYF
jgi:hypothetical protein